MDAEVKGRRRKASRRRQCLEVSRTQEEVLGRGLTEQRSEVQCTDKL